MSTKRWALVVRVGGKEHKQTVKADTLELATWALRSILSDLEDNGAFKGGDAVDCSVRPLLEAK